MKSQNIDNVTLNEIERIVYIWARYSGERMPEPQGKKYTKSELRELIGRLQRYEKNPETFCEGFEKVEEEE